MEQGVAPAIHVRYFLLDAAIMQYGKDWKKVEQYVRTRTGSQVRSHAQKFFSRLLKAAPNDPHPRRQEHSETEMDF
jgi:SHAQKYF class myb-like DNA-binding protein